MKEEPSFKSILQDKIDLNGVKNIEVYEAAAEEYHRQMKAFDISLVKKLPKLRQRYVVFLFDVDADSGDVSQMLPVAYTELEHYAKEISDYLNTQDDGGDGSRKYKFIQL